MSADPAEFPACCVECPYLDAFHGSCSHEMRQALLWELAGEGRTCSVYTDIQYTAGGTS